MITTKFDDHSLKTLHMMCYNACNVGLFEHVKEMT